MCLRLLCALAVAGCATSPSRSTLAPSVPSDRHPAVVTTTNNQPIRRAAESELGADAAQAIPPATRAVPQPAEPGAAAIVQAISKAIADRAGGPGGQVRIGLWQLRNQSRCNSPEFAAFRERFAGLLNRAAKDSQTALAGNAIEFTADPDAAVDFELQGAAYLITAQGFDVWELFPSLSPTEPAWTIWQSPNPLRVLRQARPGQAQILNW